MSRIDTDLKNADLIEKETKHNTCINKSEKRNNNKNNPKNKEYNEIKNNQQTTYILNNKLDISNFQENKNEINLNLLKQNPIAKENFNLNSNLDTNNIINNNDINIKNHNFIGGFNDNKFANRDFGSNYNAHVEEKKNDFSFPNKNNINNFNNNPNDKNYLNKKTIQNAFAKKIKKNFFEEEAKNAHLANEDQNDASNIGFFNNEDFKMTNTLELLESPDIRKKYSNNKLLNHMNSNNDSYSDNNISVIQNMESRNLMDINNFQKQKTSSEIAFIELIADENKQISQFNNSKIDANFNSNVDDVNNKSNLKVSGNKMIDGKNISNNNIIKSKLIDSIAKGKNIKNFGNALMNKKSIFFYLTIGNNFSYILKIKILILNRK